MSDRSASARLDERELVRLATLHLPRQRARIYLLHYVGDAQHPPLSVHAMASVLRLSRQTVYRELQRAQVVMGPIIRHAQQTTLLLPVRLPVDGNLRFKMQKHSGAQVWEGTDTTARDAQVWQEGSGAQPPME